MSLSLLARHLNSGQTFAQPDWKDSLTGPVYRVAAADHRVDSAAEQRSVSPRWEKPGMHPAVDQEAGRGRLFTPLGLMEMSWCPSPSVALVQSDLTRQGGYY